MATIRCAVVAGLAMMLIVGGVRAQENGNKVNLSFDHFYNHAELTKALRSLAEAYPELATLESAGKSLQGRELWAITIHNPKTGPAEHKPGFYIDGNIHGNEIQGGEAALYVAWYLLTHYGSSEQVTRLLDEKVFYIIPTMNPDSRDYYIAKAADPNSPRSGLMPRDDDRDGTCDEDGPDDLDGDGSITMMRRKDPNGRYKTLAEDPRILVAVKSDEKGEYDLLGTEGIDNDGDGRVNEDGPGGYDMNRNYGYNWMPDYVQRGAGDYPFCWPETQAIRDFLLAHPNIAAAQNFHNNGGYILRGPGANNLGDFPSADVRVYDYIGKRGEKILPGYRYMTVYKDLYMVYGGSIDFLHCTLGVFAFTNELNPNPDFSGGAALAGTDENAEYYSRILGELNQTFYYDKVLLGEATAPWKPYHHPLYGDVEIGGVKKFGRRVPPLFHLAETCHRNAMFCLFHAEQLPRLSMDEPKIKELDGGLRQIDVTVHNEAITPTMSAAAVQGKLFRADRLEVRSGTAGGKIELLAAGEVTDEYRKLTRKMKCHDGMFRVEGGIGGFGKRDFSILIKGEGEVKLVFDSLKGGRVERKAGDGRIIAGRR